jgi:hypothetical protein
MLYLVGSRALEYWDCNYVRQGRTSNVQDYDFICEKADFKALVKHMIDGGFKIIEMKFSSDTNKAYAKFKTPAADSLIVIEASLVDVPRGLQESDLEIYKYMSEDHYGSGTYLGVLDADVRVAHRVVLYLMKQSHKYLKNSPHFEKTRQDIKYLNEYFRGPIAWKGDLGAMLKKREELTYNYKLPNLKQSKEGFFTDSVPYKYDHDSIHEAVKHLHLPAYKHYVKDGEEVFCDKDKWDALPDIIKLYGVLEESYVLALERSIIPYDTDYHKAFKMALEKVCTSITSGWFREFAYYNYDKVMEMYSDCFVDKFLSALNEGKILPYKGSKY